MEKKNTKIRIGISNGQIPGNKLSFPPAFHQKSRLHYYSHLFNTIEVNSCFYRTPLRTTYEKWTADVPDDFQFSLKLSKDITHHKELAAEVSCMESFINAAYGTGSKKGCLLVQFPGKITIEHFTQVEKLLEQLAKSDPTRQWKTAVEFRDDSWYIGETTELLDAFGATEVLHDFKKGKRYETDTKADFAYMRFHGPEGNYRDSYPLSVLQEKVSAMRALSTAGKDVYAYFNNTAGDAFANARTIQSLLAQ